MKDVKLYCQEVFKDSVDKAGSPYYNHCEFVGETAFLFARELNLPKNVCEEIRLAGYLHDVIEDTDITLEDLVKDFSPKVAELVLYMTHKEEDSYEVYFQKLLEKKEACVIKYADSLHNSKIERFSKEERTEKRIKKCEKYKVRSDFLKQKLLSW